MATQPLSVRTSPPQSRRRAAEKQPSAWGNQLFMWILYGSLAVGALLFLGVIYVVLLS